MKRKQDHKHRSGSSKHKKAKDHSFVKAETLTLATNDAAPDSSLSTFTFFGGREQMDAKKVISKLKEEKAVLGATVEGLEIDKNHLARVVEQQKERMEVVGANMRRGMNTTLKSHLNALTNATEAVLSYANGLQRDYPAARAVILSKAANTLESCQRKVAFEEEALVAEQNQAKKRKREDRDEESDDMATASKKKAKGELSGFGDM